MNVKMVTSRGDIILTLHVEKAPGTVDNFITYIRSGHYEGTIFHRVIENFMIQGGGFDDTMRLKPTGAPIANEADNGLKNKEGAIAMARTPEPHSATAQFFINTADNEFLDFRSETEDGWGYCVFGEVTDGMDVVRSIEESETSSRDGYSDVPAENIIIERIEIL